MSNRIFSGFLPPLFLAATAVGFASGCATNPVTGTPDLVFMTETKEIELGNSYDSKVKKQYSLYPDPELQAYVQGIGEKLAAQSHRPQLKYHFTVLDSPEVNAFALPGGHIYITRGILAYINSEAELAAVLGHEIGHVTARHGVRQHSAATATGVVGAILGAATGIQGTQDLFNVFGNVILSGYGRDHELESDRLGAQYLARTGYDPQAMIEVVGILKNQEEFEKKRAAVENRPARIYHGVFASHPSADQRLQEVVAEADKFKTLSAPSIKRVEYFKRIDKLTFGDGAREGIRRGRLFYHRDLDLALTFPEGWHIENTPNAIISWNPGKEALLQVEKRSFPSDSNTPLESFLKSQVRLGNSFTGKPIPDMKLPSVTDTANIAGPFGKRLTRVSAVHYGPNAYIFFGATKDPAAFTRYDADFLATAVSLRALKPAEKILAEGQRLRLVRARPGDNFAALAKKSPLEKHGESTLRLINAKFPDGEPQAGEYIKIVE
ncbi:MAG: M48 family metalloprotease [Sulfuricaulis sp.]|nr:M48 family metalloprotease [Sulfuricaulis sp.]